MVRERSYAVLIAIVVAILVVFSLVLYEYAGIKQNLLKTLVFGVVVSVGTFLIVRLFFVKFAEQKIKAPPCRSVHIRWG